MEEQQRGSNPSDISGEDNSGPAQQLAMLQEVRRNLVCLFSLLTRFQLYQRHNSNLMNQLQQCSQMSPQDYLQSLQLFASLSGGANPLDILRQGGIPINNTDQQQKLASLASSAPSSGFCSGNSNLPDPQRSFEMESPKESPLHASTSGGTLASRNRRAFSGSGQTISQHTRDRLKTMIATKKKQRLHSASSIGSQSSASSNSNVSWLKESGKAGSDLNLITPLSPGPEAVVRLLQQQKPSFPAPMTPHFEPYPNPALMNSSAANQLSEFQLRKVNSEPNLKMKLRARLLSKGSSPVTHVHPYNNVATSSHHRPLQR